MRIHSDHLTPADVYGSVKDLPGVYVEVSQHGSRSRAKALEMRLTGTSNRRTMDGADQAATWDEWGVVMARLFNLDANALMHKEDYAAFNIRTGGRFLDLVIPADTHDLHRWEFNGYAHECKKCSATMGRV